MLTIIIILTLLGLLLTVICMGAVVLIDPLIAILVIYGIYKLVKCLAEKRSKK